MEEFKHLVVVKFKEEAIIHDIINGLETLVSQIDTINSFIWGIDIESEEMLRQGFTHAFLMTFKCKQDFISFASHPKHIEFSSTFSTVIDKVFLLDFPVVFVKPPLPPTLPPTLPPPPLENPPLLDESTTTPTPSPTPPPPPPPLENTPVLDESTNECKP